MVPVHVSGLTLRASILTRHAPLLLCWGGWRMVILVIGRSPVWTPRLPHEDSRFTGVPIGINELPVRTPRLPHEDSRFTGVPIGIDELPVRTPRLPQRGSRFTGVPTAIDD